MYKAIIIGGSAGSFQIVCRILQVIPEKFNFVVFTCLHRLKNISGGVSEALTYGSDHHIIEPDDKDPVLPGKIYAAPSNYHMYIEQDYHFALSTEPPVYYSRPSIDLSFASAAEAFRHELTGIVLSGANQDGARGLAHIQKKGGTTVVQDPGECEVAIMCLKALEQCKPDHVFTSEKIVNFISEIE